MPEKFLLIVAIGTPAVIAMYVGISLAVFGNGCC